MAYRFGFIGTGNMGGGLAKAAAKAMPASQILLSNRTYAKAAQLADKIGAQAVSVQEAAQCELIFLGVKPQMMAGLLEGIAPILAERTDTFALVSMAAGLTMLSLQKMAGGAYPVIRIMPNTPVAVGNGIVLYDYTENLNSELLDAFVQGMGCAGVLDHLSEDLIDAGTSVAGCGPAFAFYFMESLIKGGVACGLPEEKATLYAKYMLLGSARLALESTQSPEQLRNAVCSPAGSTIEGVHVLENQGFSDTTAQAVMASYKRNIELGK